MKSKLVGFCFIALLVGAFKFFADYEGAADDQPALAADQPVEELPPADIQPPPAAEALPAEAAPADPPAQPRPENELGQGCPVPAYCAVSQLKHVITIVQVGQQLLVPPRGWHIAVATAMVESTLHNYASADYQVTQDLPNEGVRDDHDSVGLFQQRPSQGWGNYDPAVLMDPARAATEFYNKLMGVIAPQFPGWEKADNQTLGRMAQLVQISAYPDKYQRQIDNATALVDYVLSFMA